jgi:signal transduction histidine kinase
MVSDLGKRPAVAGSRIRARLRRATSRLLRIERGDLVRRTLNRGLQLVILGFSACALLAILYGAMAGATLILAVMLAFAPISGLAFLLTRRGGVGGALLLMAYAALAVAIVVDPASYADPPVIQAIFMIPALIGALFVTPWFGLAGALLQATALAAALMAAGQPLPVMLNFLALCMLDLVGVTLPIAMVASLFRRTVARLDQLTARLDGEVAERTAELRRQMILREKDMTALVHDIQNRMTVVRAEVDDLIDEAAAGAPRAELQVAEGRVSGAIGAVNDLLGDLRMAAQLDNDALQLTYEPLDLELLVRRVTDQLGVPAARSRCQLVVSSSGELPPIAGDERKLERVLANLIGNGIKYSCQVPPERRRVAIALRPAPGAGGVELLIADSGPGLDAAALSALGQPFVRLATARGTDGMGLGVYISRGIVELHGGRISFSSPGPGQGTVVAIRLPAARIEAAPAST